MNRTEAWLLHVSTAVLTITGLSYAYMRHILKPSDPFSVVNHPLEPHMLNIHIIAAPLLVFAVGIIAHSHILWKLENQMHTARKSGIILIPLFLVMSFSGYLLQVFPSARTFLFYLHLVSGVLWFLLYVGHYFASLSLRRSMSRQAELQQR